MTTMLASQIAPVVGILWALSWFVAITFVGDRTHRRSVVKK